MANEGAKIPPQALEAEQAVLGAMILYPTAMERGLELLSAEMFYANAHATVFNRMEQLVLGGSQVDILTVTDGLDNHGELDKVGGAEYIAQLVEAVITPAHFDEHAKLVEDKALLRKVVEVCTYAIDRAYTAPGEVRNFVDTVEADFYKISERKLRGDFVPIHSIAKSVHDEVLHMQKQQKMITGTSSGYSDLDNILTGFHPSDYIVLAGRTSCGKTAFALSLARNIAIRADEDQKRGVAIFSLEMAKEQVALRILAAEAKIDAQHMRQGYLTTAELNELSLKLEKVANAPIYIDDSASISVMEMRTKARRLSRRADIGLIIVDYLQLVSPVGRHTNRQEEVASISRSLKALARELDATVLALAQLSRRVEETRDNKPRLSHLRESGAIEQDADVVLLLYRPEIHGIDTIEIGNTTTESKGLATLMIAKQRNGPIGDVYFVFHKDSISFDPYAKQYSDGTEFENKYKKSSVSDDFDYADEEMGGV